VNAAAAHDFGTTCADSPTKGALGQVDGKGFGEWNLDAHYAFSRGCSASAGIYNLFNAHVSAAEFWYVDRLHGEAAAGVADVHEHPLEPIMARFTVTKKF
jgi:outer membrane receptor for ferrienterochelin and colicin